MVSHNGYLTSGSNVNTHSITVNGNVSVAGWVMPLVTIPFLDFSHDSLNLVNSLKII